MKNNAAVFYGVSRSFFGFIWRVGAIAIVKGMIFGVLMASFADAATNYYVSPSGGSDSNPGTLDKPFLTLTKARDVVRTVNGNMVGDITVNLREGWYVLTAPLTFDDQDSGTNGHNVIYQAYAYTGAHTGEYPVISGGQQITGWSVHDVGKNIWVASAPVGLDTRQLYVNCIRAVRAHSGAPLPDAVITATGYTTSNTTMQTWLNPSNIEFVYTGFPNISGDWTEQRCGVASISGTNITMKQPGFNDCLRSPGSIEKPTDIENAYELLDQPGEWYLDQPAGLVYYIPRDGENMANARVIVPVLEALVSGTGVLGSPIHNIQFKGITFAHVTWLFPNGNGGFPESQANFTSQGFPPAGVTFKAAQALRFERCVFKHLGGVGLELSGGAQDCVVEGCVFTDISSNCILLGSVGDPVRSNTWARDSGNQVLNCYIHDSPCEYHGGIGIFAGYVSDLLVSHNEIGHTSYSAISIGWGWGQNSYAQNDQIAYNDISNWGERLCENGAIYSLSAQPDSAWHHNYAHDAPDIHPGYESQSGGFALDQGSAYIDIHDNVVKDIGAGGSWCGASNWPGSEAHDLIIRDNFHDTAKGGILPGNGTMTNNQLVIDDDWPQAALDIMAGAGIESDYSDVKDLPCGCSSPTFLITASVGAHGTISPSGTVKVVEGDNLKFTITPNLGYHVSDVLVGGSSVGVVFSHTFENIQADSTISVSFAINRSDISGKVTEGATNLGDVTITLSSSDLPLTDPEITLTDDDGMYYFNDIVSGNYTLTPTLTGHIFWPAQIKLKPFLADAPLIVDIFAYLPFEITVPPSGTPNPVVENGSVSCKVTVPDAVRYSWTADRGHFEGSGVRTSSQQNPTWVADIGMTDSALFETVELTVIAYADDGRSVSDSYLQQVNKFEISTVNSDSGGGGAVGPLAVGISALLGWWKRRRKVVRP